MASLENKGGFVLKHNSHIYINPGKQDLKQSLSLAAVVSVSSESA
jgi:hypothetical protein